MFLPIELIINIIVYCNYDIQLALLKSNKDFNKSNEIKSNIIKYAEKHLYNTLNKNYISYKNCIQNVKFNELFITNLFYYLIDVENMKTQWTNNYMCGYYDLKYIFEVLYYMHLNNIDVNTTKISHINLHFMNFYNKFNDNNIFNNSRQQTIVNINNCLHLLCLHKDFIGYNKKTRKPLEKFID